MHIHQSVFQEDGSAGGLTREANTVYISIMNQVAEREENTEKKEGGWNGGMDGESHFPSAVSSPLATNPCGDYSLYSHFPFLPSIFSFHLCLV